MESWNSAFKFECGERFDDNEIAEAKTFDYIEVFWGSTYASEDYQDVLAAHGITCDNRKRRHSAIGMVSPAEFERMFTQRQAA